MAQPPGNPTSGPNPMPRPGSPGQIDVSLTLLGGESKQLLESFSTHVAELTASLRDVVKQQESILTSLGQILPSVGGAGPGAYQGAGASMPPAAPKGQGGDNSSRPSDGLRTRGTGVRQGQGHGSGNEDDIYIPRIGEFNSQDILNQLRHVTGLGAGAAQWVGNKISAPAASVASAAAVAAGTAPTIGQQHAWSALSGIASGVGAAPGMASGILNKMSTGLGMASRVAPYLGAFTQTTGIPLTPGAMVRQGTSMGLAPGGTNLGPFRIPGLNISMPDLNPLDILSNGIGGSGFLGGGGISVSPAMKESLAENAQAAAYGMTPGGSAKWMRGAQESLKQLGWSGSDLHNMAGGWGALQSSQQYGQGAIGSSSTVAPMIDQMIRFGSSSLGDFVQVLKQLPDAARAANLQIDASNQLLNQFAEMSKSQGMNYTQGLEMGAGIQTGTGMAATTLQQAMTNPLVAGPLAAENQMLPGTTMQLGAGANTQALYSTVQQYWKMFLPQQQALHGDTQMAKDQTAFLMTKLFPSLSTQQIESMVNVNANQVARASGLSENLTKFSTQMTNIDQQQMSNKWGSKAYNQKVVGDLNKNMWDHFAPQIYKEAQAVGVKPNTAQWTQIFGNGKTNPADKDPQQVMQRLQQYIANQAKGNTMAGGNQNVVISFTPQAQKWLQTAQGQTAAQSAAAGQSNINTPAATSPYVGQAYSAGAPPAYSNH